MENWTGAEKISWLNAARLSESYNAHERLIRDPEDSRSTVSYVRINSKVIALLHFASIQLFC